MPTLAYAAQRTPIRAIWWSLCKNSAVFLQLLSKITKALAVTCIYLFKQVYLKPETLPEYNFHKHAAQNPVKNYFKLGVPDGRVENRRNKFLLLILTNTCINKCSWLKICVLFHLEMKIECISCRNCKQGFLTVLLQYFPINVHDKNWNTIFKKTWPIAKRSNIVISVLIKLDGWDRMIPWVNYHTFPRKFGWNWMKTVGGVAFLKLLTSEILQSAPNDPKMNSKNGIWKVSYICISQDRWVPNYYPFRSTTNPFQCVTHFRIFPLTPVGIC